jgi:hypothetical protein
LFENHVCQKLELLGFLFCKIAFFLKIVVKILTCLSVITNVSKYKNILVEMVNRQESQLAKQKMTIFGK